MVTRTELETIADEMELQLSGFTSTSDNERIELGELYNIKNGIFGNVSKAFGKIVVSVELIDMQNGKITHSENMDTSDENIFTDLRELALSLASSIDSSLTNTDQSSEQTSKFSSVPTTVAGFINIGDESDDNLNEVITKSIIHYLNRIPGTEITTYDDVVEYAEENDFYKTGEIDPDLTTGMGYIYGAEKVLVGEYSVDHDTDMISGTFYLYDVRSGEVDIYRNFEGDAGIDLFDTVDEIVKKASIMILGSIVDMGTLIVEIEDPERDYLLYINGYYQDEINSANGFSGEVAAEQSVEVSLRLDMTGGEKEVYSETVFVAEDAEYTITFDIEEDIDPAVLKEILSAERLELPDTLIPKKESVFKRKPLFAAGLPSLIIGATALGFGIAYQAQLPAVGEEWLTASNNYVNGITNLSELKTIANNAQTKYINYQNYRTLFLIGSGVTLTFGIITLFINADDTDKTVAYTVAPNRFMLHFRF